MASKRGRGRRSRPDSRRPSRRQGHPARRAERRAHDASGAPSPREIVHRLADGLREVGGALTDPLEAAMAASQFCEAWALPEPFDGRDLEAAVGVPVVHRLEELGGAESLAMLRALEIGANDGVGVPAMAAASRLTESGVEDPEWYATAREIRPVAAARLGEDVFDDGETIIVEFEDAGGQSFTLGVFIDRALGGIATNLLVGASIADHRDEIARQAEDNEEISWIGVHELDFEAAKRRALTAMRMTAATFEPEVGDGFTGLHALVWQRLRDLPGAEPDDDDGPEAVPDDVRRAVADAFFASDHGRAWSAPAAGASSDAIDRERTAETVVRAAIDFAADETGGDPLRWSPVVVELFMLDWLPRRVTLPATAGPMAADIVHDWARHTAADRQIPPRAVTMLDEAVDRHRDEMSSFMADESHWGPAKTIAMRAIAEGVDAGDPDAMQAFIDRVNRDGGA